MNTIISRVARALRPLPLLLALGGAQASSLELLPALSAAQIGDTVEVALWMDFSDDPTLGGGIDVFYAPGLLQYLGFIFDAALGDDPAFRRLPDVLAGELNGLAFGQFNGLSGPARVGTFSFRTLAEGPATLSMTANDVPAGGFVSAVSFSAQSPQFVGATVQIAPIPEPASLALMMFGVGSLLAWRHRASRRPGGR